VNLLTEEFFLDFSKNYGNIFMHLSAVLNLWFVQQQVDTLRILGRVSIYGDKHYLLVLTPCTTKSYRLWKK
jgi:hypothetical protein